MGRKKKEQASTVEAPVSTIPDEKRAKLQNILREFNKNFKEDVIHFGSDEQEVTKVGFGIKPIDDVLGGGIPRGKFSVLWGPPGCGKTTLCYNLIAQAQKQGLTVGLVAQEGFDIARAMKFGVVLESLVLIRCPKAEQALDIMIKLSKEKAVDVLILDSIQAFSPKGEQEEKSGKEKSTENDTMALVARKLSQFFRMATDPVFRGNVAVLLIGQTRTNVGFIAFDQLSGGNALKHYSKLILHLKRGQKSDSPTEKQKNDEGEKETVAVGFDCVLELDKVQIPNCKPERTKIHLPYYYDIGFCDE